jgi:hypothetical protein
MAFEKVGATAYKKLTDLKEGESLTGYLLATKDGKLENSKTLVMRIDGASVDVSAAGNVRYLINDNKLAFGFNTRITRSADKIVKGKKSTNYIVEQDASDTIEVGNQAAGMASTGSAANTSIADKINKLKGK